MRTTNHVEDAMVRAHRIGMTIYRFKPTLERTAVDQMAIDTYGADQHCRLAFIAGYHGAKKRAAMQQNAS